jgi:tetratricopeptide (TPR) repeat protein/transglutaminase-like putative cysteine protease
MSQKRPLVVGLTAVLALPLAFAQQKPAAPPALAARDFSKEAYTIERSDVRIAFENDGTGSRQVSSEIKILADAGVKAFAVLNFTYTSANETVDIDYVRVRKPDGTIVKTPDYNVQDMPADVTRTAPLYSDVHEKHVAVKGLGVGDVLEYQVKYRVVKPEVPGHFWQEYSFAKAAISKDERLEINVPSGKYVKVVSPEFKPEIAEENGRRIYRWKQENLIVPEKDPNEIPRRIPPNPDVQVTTFSNWEQVGNWYGGLQKDPLEVTAAIQAKAAELTKGMKTDDEKIHAIYNFVSLKYHYIGLDFGIGRYQPHAADDVLDNGYGDCKDKHTLLAALLKAAGIEAWPALIHSTRKLDPDVPSPAQFNHVITVVPRGGVYLWLDTTPEVSPYGLLMQILRDKQALVIPVSKPPLLLTTPANPPFASDQQFSMEGKLNGEGTFTGHAEQSYRGDTEVLLRSIFRQISESQWKEAVQRFSYGLNFGGDVSNVKISSPDDLDQPFKISYDYVRKNYGDWENRQITPPLPPMGVEFSKDGREKKPQDPVPLGALGKVAYHARLELPAGYRATAPEDRHLSESYAEYTAKTRIERGVMTTTRELVVKKNEVALSDWENFRKFGRAVSDDEYAFIPLKRGSGDITADAIDIIRPDNSSGGNETTSEDADAVFKQATSALQRRDIILARELLQKVLQKDPKYKGAHRALGALFMVQNKPQDALSEFQKEEEISPDDVRTIQAAAYAANLTGNKDLAVAEARKLLKADPTNQTGASTLAGLLTQQSKYSEAADVLEAAVKKAPERADLQFQLGNVYLKNKQTEQAVSHMKAAAEQKEDDPMMLNNVAYTLAEGNVGLDMAKEYAEKAVDELDDTAQGSESSDEAGMRVTYLYSMVWDTLGWVYFQQGDLKRAESLVRAAWLLGEDTIVAEHLGEIYEKEGKKEQAARAYEFALAVSPVPAVPTRVPPNAPNFPTPNLDRTLVDKIVARYEKLMGKKPSPEIRRLPNGEWTQTPAEQLRHSREIKIGNEGKRSGSAQFTLVLKEDKTSVRYASGNDTLEPLLPKLEAAHYPLEIPPDSAAILTVRLDVNCQEKSPCVATLVNPVPPRTQVAGATY